MDVHTKKWDCTICGKNLRHSPTQCYNDRKYCSLECIEKIIEQDENFELYKIIEPDTKKRHIMKNKIDAKYNARSYDYLVNLVDPTAAPTAAVVTQADHTASVTDPTTVLHQDSQHNNVSSISYENIRSNDNTDVSGDIFHHTECEPTWFDLIFG